jgi:hypothetical protein
MKILSFITLSLVLSVQSISAQVYSFKSTAFSVQEKNEGKWGKWSDFKESTIIISIDGKKDRVIIGSKEIQLYKIESYGQKKSTTNDDTVTLNCRDNAGNPCTILIITRKNQNNRKQFYVNFNDIRIVYNVYSSN